MEFRSKKEIKGDIRIIRIEDADTCACCGTHVSYTGAVGQIKVISQIKYKKGVRLELLCGERALCYENAIMNQIKQISRLLSVQEEHSAEAVDALERECMSLRGEKNHLALCLFEKEAMKGEYEEGIALG